MDANSNRLAGTTGGVVCRRVFITSTFCVSHAYASQSPPLGTMRCGHASSLVSSVVMGCSMPPDSALPASMPVAHTHTPAAAQT